MPMAYRSADFAENEWAQAALWPQSVTRIAFEFLLVMIAVGLQQHGQESPQEPAVTLCLPLADADDAQGVRVARGAGGRPALRAPGGGERQSGRLVHGLES